MTDLLLVRHAQATHNLEGRWEGWGATPLTEEGQCQAQALARRLASWVPAVTCLHSSPLLRAWQTAEPIAHGLQITPIAHEGLREIDFGQVSGQTLESFRQTMPDVYAHWQDRTDLTFQFPGGEQRSAFFHRVGQVLDEIVGQHRCERVIVVSHGGTLRAALAHLFPETMRDWWAYDLHNASLTHVHAGEQGHVLVALNDCHHLESA